MKSSSSKKKGPSHDSATTEQDEPAETLLYSSMMTYPYPKDGLREFITYLDAIKILKEFQDLLSFLASSAKTGTSSGSVSRNGYTIHFSAKGSIIFLGISCVRGLGLPEPAMRRAITKVKSCFSKLVTWLLKKKFLKH